MGNPHLHEPELTYIKLNTHSTMLPFTDIQRNFEGTVFYQNIDQNGSAVRRKKAEKTLLQMQARKIFWHFKNMSQAFSDLKYFKSLLWTFVWLYLNFCMTLSFYTFKKKKSGFETRSQIRNQNFNSVLLPVST